MAPLPRPSSFPDKAWRIALYLVAVSGPLVVSVTTGGDGLALSFDSLGRCAGLLAFGTLAAQFILSARFLWIEGPFGLDRIYGFHRTMGLVAGALLLSHPLLLAVGGYGSRLFTDLGAPWEIWVGKATLALLLLLAGAALGCQALRLNFETWRLAHGAVATVVLLAAIAHGFRAGGDLQGFVPRGVFAGYAAAALVCVAYAKAAMRLDRGRTYTVGGVKQETHNTWTVTLRRPEGRPRRDYLPGQFHFLVFRTDGRLPTEEHPFTISSDPLGGETLASTIKASGDFTRRIGELRPGDRASVSPPYGRFSYVLHPDETDLVFVAGGIGITPFISMIRHLRSASADRTVLLLYGNRTEADVVFREELAAGEAAERPRLRVVHVLSQPSASWDGETGFIDGEKLERLCGELRGKGFYVCGPPPMMRQVTRALRRLGVPSARVHYERFAL